MTNRVDIQINSSANTSGVDQMNSALGETQGAVDGAKISLTDFKSGVDLITQGLQYAQQAYSATVGELMTYAEQVRELGQVNGQTAEQNSRLIQLVDDYKVSIADLTATQKELTKDGKVMSAEFLAGVAEQYANAATQADKNKIAQDNLGRSYRSYIELLQQGPDAIREQAAAISESNILSQEAIDMAREQEKAVDGLGDALSGITSVITQQAMPAIVDLTSFLKDGADGWAEYFADRRAYLEQERITIELMKAEGIEIPKNDQMRGRWLQSNQELVDSFRLQAVAQMEATRATNEQNSAAQEYIPTAEEEAAVAKAVSDALSERISIIQKIQDADEQFTEKSKSLAEERNKVELEISDLRRQGYSDYGKNIQDQLMKLDEITEKEKSLAEERAKQTLEFEANMLRERLARDGWTEGEEKAFEKQMIAWGLWEQSAVDSANAVIERVQDTADAIDGLPTAKTIDIYYMTHGDIGDAAQTQAGGYAYAASGGTAQHHANGGSWVVGPSWGNEGYPMGGGHTASAGETITVTPANKSAPSGPSYVQMDDTTIQKLALAIVVATGG